MQKTEILILKADEGKWLYHDEVDASGNVTRNFVHGVHNADLKDWGECTDEEKVVWEEEHYPKIEPPLDENGNPILPPQPQVDNEQTDDGE